MKKIARPWWQNEVAKFSIYKATEGGLGFKLAKELLAGSGIPCRHGYSPYVGQVGLIVPKKMEKRATRVLFP